MLRMEMGRLGVSGWIAKRNQRDRNIILGKIQLLLQRLVVETADPACAEALFGGFQLNVIHDDGAVDGADRFAFVVVPTGFRVITDNERHGSAELIGCATADFVENGRIIDDQDALRLVVAARGGQGGGSHDGIDFLWFDGLVAVFPQRVARFGKL